MLIRTTLLGAIALCISLTALAAAPVADTDALLARIQHLEQALAQTL